jgi:hypothetical protein
VFLTVMTILLNTLRPNPHFFFISPYIVNYLADHAIS